jgi:hypothetical protein
MGTFLATQAAEIGYLQNCPCYFPVGRELTSRGCADEQNSWIAGCAAATGRGSVATDCSQAEFPTFSTYVNRITRPDARTT